MRLPNWELEKLRMEHEKEMAELTKQRAEERYWRELKHQYAGMAMLGIVMNEKMQEDLYKAFGKNESMDITISEFAIDIATALVEKLNED